jgi:hypothetical protein
MSELGSKWLLAGKLERAAQILDESVAAARHAGSEPVLGYGLVIRGFAALAQEKPALAGLNFSEGLILAHRFRMDRTSLAAIGGLAGVALALAQPERSARLLGAVEAAKQSSGVGRIQEEGSVDAIRHAARDRLGHEFFDEHSTFGGRLTYGEAVDEALEIRSAIAPAPCASS